MLRYLIAGISLLAVSAFAGTPGKESSDLAQRYGIEIPAPAPDSATSDAVGPFSRLVIENVLLIDGRGAPPRGPVSIVIENDVIERVISGPAKVIAGEHRIDGRGMTAMPGFIDAHAHVGYPFQGLAGPITPPEYIFKLWLGHGITTVRDVGSAMGLGWTVDHARRSAAGEITAPRIIPYAMFPGGAVTDAKSASEWVKAVKARGAEGVKLRGGTREAQIAVYEETEAQNMGTANHHDQTGVYHMNVLDSARLGLDSMEHWYGLPEALFVDRTIQDYPSDYNYLDEQSRFSEAGKLWQQAAKPGSPRYEAVISELLRLDFTLVPTFTIYEANRDVAKERDAEWHEDYSTPALMKFFMPDPRLHGSYHFDWTTGMEVTWRENFRLWMQFVNDYKNRGGRVATGSDAGFIFKLFGFAYIRELELLQEAGFHPLEVIQAATYNGAELLGMQNQIGSVVPGQKADLVLVEGNPIQNFKVLYGTGHMKLNREEGELERVGGVTYTIKDGIVYDAKRLLADVRQMVAEAKAEQRTGRVESSQAVTH